MLLVIVRNMRRTITATATTHLHCHRHRHHHTYHHHHHPPHRRPAPPPPPLAHRRRHRHHHNYYHGCPDHPHHPHCHVMDLIFHVHPLGPCMLFSLLSAPSNTHPHQVFFASTEAMHLSKQSLRVPRANVSPLNGQASANLQQSLLMYSFHVSPSWDSLGRMKPDLLRYPCKSASGRSA